MNTSLSINESFVFSLKLVLVCNFGLKLYRKTVTLYRKNRGKIRREMIKLFYRDPNCESTVMKIAFKAVKIVF